jgi:hypothetical protein
MRREKSRVIVTPSPPSVFLQRILVAAAVAFAVFLGFHRFPVVTSEPGGYFTDPDALFHVRRVVRTIETGSFLPPVFDAWESFPEGGRAVWPPLHDALLALSARIGGSTASEPRRGLTVAAAVPVVELGAIVLVVSLLARKLAGERSAVFAAWLAALTPALIRRCAFGEVDHNATEVLGWLTLLLLATYVSIHKEPSWRRDVLISLAWGGALLVSLGFHAGLVLAAAVVSGGFVLLDLVDERSAGLQSARIALSFGLAGALLPAFASLRVQPDPTDPWRLGPVYCLMLALGAAGLGLASIVAGFRFRSISMGRHAMAALSIVLGAATVALQPAGAWTGLARGLGFVGSRDPWLSTIDEFQPLVLSKFSLFSTAPALPVGLLAMFLLLTWRERKNPIREFLPVGAVFVVVTALALVQKRFVPTAAALGAIVAGLAWRDLALDSLRRRLVYAGGLVGLAATLDFTPLYISGSLGRSFRADGTLQATAFAVGELTPAPGPEPAWGVLAPWDFGHFILGLSGRAVALNNFGTWHPGFARKSMILLEGSPERAVAEMDALRLRYFVTTWPTDVVPNAVTSLRLDPALWDPVLPIGDGIPVAGPGSMMERTMAARLFVRDGRPYDSDSPADRAALRRFRKIWQMPTSADAPFPDAKLFELMPVPARSPSPVASRHPLPAEAGRGKQSRGGDVTTSSAPGSTPASRGVRPA